MRNRFSKKSLFNSRLPAYESLYEVEEEKSYLPGVEEVQDTAGSQVTYFESVINKPSRFNIFKKLPSVEEKLLDVYMNEPDKVNKSVKKYPELYFKQGNFIPPRQLEKPFETISLPQLAKWCHNPMAKPLWEEFFRLYPEEAIRQFEQSESIKTSYVAHHGISYNFEPIEQAYEEYVNHYAKWHQEQREDRWGKKIGGLQRSFPGWFAQCLCSGTNNWEDPADAEFRAVTDSSKRTLNFYNFVSRRDESFFDSGSDLGEKFAVYALSDRAGSCMGQWATGGRAVSKTALSNLAAFRHLHATSIQLQDDLTAMYHAAKQLNLQPS